MKTTPAARQHNDSGMTLIELLIVLILIGILAAIGIPSYLKQRDKALYANAKEIARSLVVPIWEYRIERGRFPADQLNNVPPSGLRAYWVDRSKAPFESSFDYDNHGLGSGQCLAQITFFGKNRIRNSSPYSQVAEGDDLIVPISLYACNEPRGSITR
jgi:prepilin-type N-terminal cleavage/methylation domain-containing protein